MATICDKLKTKKKFKYVEQNANKKKSVFLGSGLALLSVSTLVLLYFRILAFFYSKIPSLSIIINGVALKTCIMYNIGVLGTINKHFCDAFLNVLKDIQDSPKM